jgi:hypothetical protein
MLSFITQKFVKESFFHYLIEILGFLWYSGVFFAVTLTPVLREKLPLNMAEMRGHGPP